MGACQGVWARRALDPLPSFYRSSCCAVGGGYDVDAGRGHRLETCLTGPDCGLRKLSNSKGVFGKKKTRPQVNNSFYETLGPRWYDDDTHAIALLRVEARHKLAYVLEIFSKLHMSKRARVLDTGG